MFGQRKLTPGETHAAAAAAAATAVSAAAVSADTRVVSSPVASAASVSDAFLFAANSAAANEKNPLANNIDPMDQLSSRNKVAPSQMLKLLRKVVTTRREREFNIEFLSLSSHRNIRNVQLVPPRGKGTHFYQI